MSDFVGAFNERLQEVDSYLELLAALEQAMQRGTPRIVDLGDHNFIITVQQQRILYSSVYLQLYNLVESTINQCVDAVSSAIVESSCFPVDLSDNLRREWVRFAARTHADLTYEKRLDSALRLCEHLVRSRPVADFKIEKGGGGNWDDEEIESMSKRLEVSLKITSDVYSNIKRGFRGAKRPLSFIKDLRNNLAHGTISFAECGEGMTVQDLRDLRDYTVLYLKEVVQAFKLSIDERNFLSPARRPQ